MCKILVSFCDHTRSGISFLMSSPISCSQQKCYKLILFGLLTASPPPLYLLDVHACERVYSSTFPHLQHGTEKDRPRTKGESLSHGITPKKESLCQLDFWQLTKTNIHLLLWLLSMPSIPLLSREHPELYLLCAPPIS